MHVLHRVSLAALFLMGCLVPLKAQTLLSRDPHSTPEWALIAPHLPDPASTGFARLETTGDVLRARRFPEDALVYYKAASLNGGDSARLLKKQGVIHLEMQHGLLAHLCFDQSVHLNKGDAESWNDLGAADFMLGNLGRAIGEYKRAVKLNRESAIFHSNLSLAYFEARSARNARKELARATALDPDILHHHNAGGYNLQVLASSHYAEICLEMARMAAAKADTEAALDWLAKASERGLDLRAAMRNDPALAPYLQDERVLVLLHNYDERHTRELAKDKPPALAPSARP